MDMPQSYAPSLRKIIMAESGGNPRAINTWDSNARRGTPSQGLMQTIPSTFRAYVHPSLRGRSITDPVANITAGVRYMIANYGVSTLKAGGRSNSSGDYVGY
jgi:SLT domain-containing protein